MSQPMSQLKAAALRLAQKNPGFREALKEKISATRRKKKKAPKKNKGKPTKVVESIGKFVVKNARQNPYHYLVDAAKDAALDGLPKPSLDGLTLDDMTGLDQRQQMRLADKVAEWFAKKVEKDTSKGFWADLAQARFNAFDLGRGRIDFSGVFDGEDIIDEDGDIEVPADDDMVTSLEIFNVCRQQKMKDIHSEWEFSQSDYGGMAGIRHRVSFAWEFDPTELTWMVLDKKKAQKIVDDAYERGLKDR